MSGKSLCERMVHPSPEEPDHPFTQAAPLDVLCVIPARGGSKGIPNKNIADLHGKPLISYTIEAARRSLAFSRIIVSTDSERIAEVARLHGAEVPFMRPKELASDRSVSCEVIDHLLAALAERENYRPHAFVTLYPTSPFRSPETLAYLVSKLAEGYREVLTAKPLPRETEYFHRCGETLSRMRPRHTPANVVLPFRPYGYFYGLRLDQQSERNRFVHYLEGKLALVDIDTPADLLLADRLIARGLFPSGQ